MTRLSSSCWGGALRRSWRIGPDLDFGEVVVGDSAQSIFTIQNVGDADLNISVEVEGNNRTLLQNRL